MPDTPTMLREIADDLRGSWKPLVVTDLLYKVVALVVLTPLVGVLFRVVVSLAGDTVLADQDILYFFLRPVGWVCLIAVGGLWLGIVALEQAALLAILATAGTRPVGVIGALRFAAVNARRVLATAARLIGYALCAGAPFLLVAGVAYFMLLTEFDINYYLKEKPPEFVLALAIGGGVSVGLTVVLLRLASGWFYALPLVVFENVAPNRALKTSRQRADGHRRVLIAWIVAWAVATMVVSSLASGVVVGIGRLVVPRATGSLALLAIAIGCTLIVWSVVSLAVNLLSATSFSVLLLTLYRRLGGGDTLDVESLRNASAESSFRGPRITRGRVIAAVVLGTVAAMAVGIYTIGGVRLEDDVTITAHRGASGAAPENTMASVRQAIEDGADWVEIDVQETADDQVVVFHDSDFMKLAGNRLKIWDATMSDLKNIDIGSWYDKRFQDERVPTLADVLKQCKGKAGVNIELKYYGHDKQLEQRVAEIVEAHGMADQIVLMSLKLDAVKKMKALRPDWKVGLLMSVAVGGIESIEADFLAVNASFANRSFVRRAHASDMPVHVWTVNDPLGMSVMMGRGVDSIITDEPAMARRVLSQRTEMTPAERVLLELAGILGVTPKIGEQ